RVSSQDGTRDERAGPTVACAKAAHSAIARIANRHKLRADQRPRRSFQAGVAKLADAPDLGSGGEILRGSSPLPGISLIISYLRVNQVNCITVSHNKSARVHRFSPAFPPISPSKISRPERATLSSIR